MINNKNQHKIYIVISQTGTALSRLIKFVTGDEYNHASISLAEDLSTMYSFGRKNAYNPFRGGFVMESPYWGTFKRFSNTKVVVLEVSVDTEQYNEMKEYLETMHINKESYHYNYIGLFLAGWKICYKQENHYYCSEFVKHILVKFNIADENQFNGVIQPMQLLQLPHGNITYRGKLKDIKYLLKREVSLC